MLIVEAVEVVVVEVEIDEVEAEGLMDGAMTPSPE